jgi:hypothetical protein
MGPRAWETEPVHRVLVFLNMSLGGRMENPVIINKSLTFLNQLVLLGWSEACVVLLTYIWGNQNMSAMVLLCCL